MASARIFSFPPLASKDSRILILGSMPGAASLAAGQYYAHPQNSFWRIMGALFDAGPDKPYDERTAILLGHGVAVWDVLQGCVRPGSLDVDIRDEVPNDFPVFFAAHPAISRVYLNGGKAAASYKKFVADRCGVPAEKLPSTSPAHAGMRFEDKLALWRVIADQA